MDSLVMICGNMAKTYRYTVSDVEHDGDLEPFKTAIIDGGGEVIETIWQDEDYDAVIRFTVASEEILAKVKNNLNQL